MENINNNSSATAAKISIKAIQPSLIIQALAFTGILYLSVGQIPPNSTEGIYRSESRVTLSESVLNAVLLDASQQSGLPTDALRIVDAQQRTWTDNCLELGESEVLCTKMEVPGWQVAVAGGQQRWLYRTNTSGSMIKLERGGSSPSKDKRDWGEALPAVYLITDSL